MRSTLGETYSSMFSRHFELYQKFEIINFVRNFSKHLMKLSRTLSVQYWRQTMSKTCGL
jgi:hypothetical protein